MSGIEHGSGAEGDRPYICLQDLELTVSRVAPELSLNTIANFESELFKIETEFAPETAQVTRVNATELTNELNQRAVEIRDEANGQIGVIYMDAEVGTNDPLGARLNLSRAADGKVRARIGAELSSEQQFEQIATWIKENGYQSVLLVDDVLAFGDTLGMIAKEIKALSLDSDLKFRVLAGIASTGGVWQGVEKATAHGFDVEYLQKAYAGGEIEGGTKGLAIPTSRDLTVFGGKVGLRTIAGMPTVHPYFLPFADPQASIIDAARKEHASAVLLEFNERLVTAIDDARGTPLLLSDVALKGFGIPAVAEAVQEQVDEASVTKETGLADYIAHVRSQSSY